jgi:hypothetical protein
MARIEVVTEPGVPVTERFLLRVAGWTEERYFAEAPEDRVWEFRDGELIVQSPGMPRHQDLVGFLTFLLRGYTEAAGSTLPGCGNTPSPPSSHACRRFCRWRPNSPGTFLASSVLCIASSRRVPADQPAGNFHQQRVLED